MSQNFNAPPEPEFAGIMDTVKRIDKATQDWTAQAARGECEWICSDCGTSFPKGMPDECAYGHQGCTNIIKRDKAAART